MDKFNEIIHRNINKLLVQSGVSENDVINSLAEHLTRQEVIDFFKCKTGCNDCMLIALSKYFKKNINYFVEEHPEHIPTDDSKLESIMKLQNILKLKSFEPSSNEDEILLFLTKKALKKDLITISYASYILDKPLSEVMELESE